MNDTGSMTSQDSPSTTEIIGGIVAILAVAAVVAFDARLFLAAVVGAVMIYTFMRRPERFVMFIAVYTPMEEFVLKWLPDSIYAPARYSMEGLLILMFGWMFVRRLVAHKPLWVRTPLDLPILALFAVTVASAWSNEVPDFIAVMGMKNLVRYFLLYYIVVNSELTDAYIRRIVIALMVVAGFEAAIGLAQHMGGTPADDFLKAANVEVGGMALRYVTSGTGGVYATMGRYNILGNFLTFFMLIAIGLYRCGHGGRKTLYWLFFGLTACGLLYTSSRMSWVGLYGGFILIMFIQKNKNAILYIAVPVIAMIMLVGAYEGIHWYSGEKAEASKVERLVSVFSAGYIEKSMKFDRLFALFVTAPAVLDRHPALGLGPGAFASEITGGGTMSRGLYPEYSNESELEIHNREALQYTTDQGWVSILAQLGLLGLGAVAWMLAAVARYTYRVYAYTSSKFDKGLALGYLACIGLIIFQNFVSFNLTYRAVSLYLWLFAGLVFQVSLRTRGGVDVEDSGEVQGG